MGDWWIIGDNAGLGCPSRVEFLAVWDNGDWYASDVERLRLTAGFCSSREARSAACSTAARRCINGLALGEEGLEARPPQKGAHDAEGETPGVGTNRLDVALGEE